LIRRPEDVPRPRLNFRQWRIELRSLRSDISPRSSRFSRTPVRGRLGRRPVLNDVAPRRAPDFGVLQLGVCRIVSPVGRQRFADCRLLGVGLAVRVGEPPVFNGRWHHGTFRPRPPSGDAARRARYSFRSCFRSISRNQRPSASSPRLLPRRSLESPRTWRSWGSVGDIGSCENIRGGNSYATAQHRPAGQPHETNLLPCSIAGVGPAGSIFLSHGRRRNLF